ncbi:MAG: SH3 domain-containing protein, partial [Bacillus sp. (in: firmicutes)]
AGKTGWVSSKYIKVTKPVSTKKPASNTDVRASDKTRPANQTKPASSEQKKIKTTATTLNLRNSASASSPILAKIPEGTILVPIASSKEWTQVSYGGYTGWISSAYTTTDSTKTEMTVHPYQTMDLRTISSVTAAQINNYIASKASSGDSVLYNKGQAFVNAGKKYGINALYLAAHAIHESDYGRSTISKAKNNLFGYGAFDSTPFVGAAKFDSIEGNIDFIARKMKSGYLKPGYMYYKGATLGYRVNNNGKRVDSQSTGMNYYYATDGNWGKAIALHMERMLDYSKEAAKNQAPNTFYPANPSYPNLKDVFPANTLAVANRNISLPNGKMILKGETFNLLEKHNNYVLTISDKGQRHTVFNISLSGYSSSFTVQNLGRIFTAVLNVRHAPNSTARAVGQLKNYQYVELVLDEAKKPQTSNGWYKVKLSNGQIGWASGQHITLELNK